MRFEMLQRVQHRMMLHRRGHQVAAALSPSEAGRSQYGQIVGFGAAAGEDHFAGLAFPCTGQSVAEFVQSRPGSASDGMHAGGIAPDVGQVRLHRLPDAGVQRRGGVVVPIDGIHSGGEGAMGVRCGWAAPPQKARILMLRNQTSSP